MKIKPKKCKKCGGFHITEHNKRLYGINCSCKTDVIWGKTPNFAIIRWNLRQWRMSK